MRDHFIYLDSYLHWNHRFADNCKNAISRYFRDCNSNLFMSCCKRTFLLCNDDNKTSKVEKLFRDQTKNSKENPTSIISAPLHQFQYRKIAYILICINWKQGNKIHNTFLKNYFSTCYSKHFFNNVSIIYCLRLH